MERRNEYWDYWLGTQLTPLRAIRRATKASEWVLQVYPAQRALRAIIDSQFEGLELCAEQVERLKDVIESIMPMPLGLLAGTASDSSASEDRELKSIDVARIRDALSALETALSIQFSQVNTYRVTAKGTHDVRKLIEAPYAAFGMYWYGMPAVAQGDWEAAAKCLAFELSTACGFHVVRAMEATVVDYLHRLSVIPDKRDLGHYVDLMRHNGIAQEAVDIVDQIRKHHRNPLMHPEDILDVPMAMSLYDLCRAAIISLISDMSHKQLVSLEEPEQLMLEGPTS